MSATDDHSKHKTFVLHLYNVGPTSKTLCRRCTNVMQMFCVCWDPLLYLISTELTIRKWKMDRNLIYSVILFFGKVAAQLASRVLDKI